MRAYFRLQFKMFNRNMIAFGLPLLIGYTLIPLLFVLFSNYLFSIIEFETPIYCLIALGFVSKLSDPKRNDFLKSIYNKTNYLKLRSIENLIYALPFTLFLIYKTQFLTAILLNLLGISIILFNFNTHINMTIPTPFGKKPFEFVVGFRKTFFIFPISYFLTYISITVGNFNLGVFAMILIALICLSYYSKIEHEYFVWNFNVSAKDFLFEKTKTCLTYFTILCLPILIALCICFVHEISILLVFFLLCHAYLITLIFAKYSSFPKEMNISQGILIAISIMFPPMLFVIIPLFYSQSIKKLNTVLK
ncbi:ABC transporter permease [Formosa sp. PL04]|uniref:ABC transporter permease n=1 Tax=Formosa sp. PL04 TaxID=3081755 RepID=UPI0029829542|nr:ABC transporter permease [Formosa sp. PL04]MDW5289923.1 ABC transporter permease [Formosa sp. PL04]